MSKAIILLLLLSFAVYSCATIVNGTEQQVSFSSNPSGANVSINGQDVGKTPLSTDLKRKETHFVKIELDGYNPYEMTFVRKVSGWAWGNILLGGFIGLAIDAHQGGMYKLNPEQVMAELKKDNTAVGLEQNNIYIFVTFNPSADWQKIAQMDRN